MQIVPTNILNGTNQLVYLVNPTNIPINQNNPNNLDMNNQAIPAQVIIVNNIPVSNIKTFIVQIVKSKFYLLGKKNVIHVQL